MQTFSENDIISYDNVFDENDYKTILEYVYGDRWYFGHGSFDKSDPRHKSSFPFWAMVLREEKFFTEYLLNKIQKITNQKFSIYDVYANGHTFGTKGSFHQDWHDERGKTFLYYANEQWNIEWGGKTAFDFGNGKYYFNVPKRNSAIYFPGVIPHTAEGTSRNFSGLRITIAWKLLLE